MRLHLVHLGMAASILASAPAFAGTPLLCRDIFEGMSASSGPLKIADLLGRGQSSKLTDSFKLNLAAFFQVIENAYGPLELKPSSVGLDWQKLKTDSLRKAGQLTNSNEQYYLVASILAHMNDGHVSSTLPSSLVYRLPVQMASAEGRFLIQASFESYPKSQRVPGQGDEVLAIDGKTPSEFQKQHAVWDASGNEITNRFLFSMTFGFWNESSGIPLSKITQDSVKMKIRSAANGEVYEVELPFRKEGVGLIGRTLQEKAGIPPVIAAADPVIGQSPASKATFEHLPRTSAIISDFHNLFMAQRPRLRMGSGAVKSEPGKRPIRIGELEPFFQLPEGFKPIEYPASFTQHKDLAPLMSQDGLMAGTFRRDGKTVGFLRIPSYAPEQPNLAIRQLRYLIATLEKRTDYLVIDQTNNPGGMIVFSDLVVKAFTGKWDEASHMKFSVKPTQKFLRQYIEMRNAIAKNEDGAIPPEILERYVSRLDQEYRKIHAAYQNERSLSEPISMLVLAEFFEMSYMAELLTPIGQDPSGNPVTLRDILGNTLGVDVSRNQVYTKPVFMMINELDFSAGDSTAAMLKDYGRARLVGTRTAGAGGTVEEFAFRGLNEMSFSLTTSLMVRKDGSLIENYGVQPDLAVPLKVSDVVDNYSNFFERHMQAIDQDMNSRRSFK